MASKLLFNQTSPKLCVNVYQDYYLGYTNLDDEDAPLVPDVFLESVQGVTGV